jgi:hypothetical protein
MTAKEWGRQTPRLTPNLEEPPPLPLEISTEFMLVYEQSFNDSTNQGKRVRKKAIISNIDIICSY